VHRRQRALALALTLAVAHVAGLAAGQAPGDRSQSSTGTVDAAASPTPEDRAAAAREFKDGERAFQRGDFEGAAKLFESAYKRAPHHAPVWNAARAWERAKNLPRAATLYAKFLREAPASASGRDSANSSLRELSKKLARLEVAAPGMTDLQIDGHPSDESIVYVMPGTHTIEARQEDRVVRHSQEAEAGITVGIALVASAPATAPTTAPAPANADATPNIASPPPPTGASTAPANATVVSADRPAGPVHTGLSPYVVVAGGALTVVGLVATIASGIDTQNWKNDTFETRPNQSNLDQGFEREHRTNILLGATVAVAALTGVAALWLVNWHGAPGANAARGAGSADVEIGAGLGSIAARGRF
jgi:hypothetical protein